MRSTMRILKAQAFAALALVLAAQLACSDGADEQPRAERAEQTPAKSVRQKDPLTDMVSAVSGGKGGAPVELKFSLAERPQVGQPVEIDIAVLPVSPLDRVAAHFQAGDGLVLRSGDEMNAVDRPETGVPLPHRITIVPERDGIFFVSAVVLADSPQQSISRTFSIPIIAGQGLSPPKAGAATPDGVEPKTR